MTDWDMVVESFPNGRHSFPKFTPERSARGSPSRFTTTLADGAWRRAGQFTYDDHGTPWSTVARNLNVTLYRSRRSPTTTAARASFSNGTVRIHVLPAVPAGMQSRFNIDGGQVRTSTGSISTATARRSVAHRRRRPDALARADLSGPIADRFRDAEGHLLPPRPLHRVRAGGFRRHVPSVQGRPRAEGHVHQPGRRRQRLALSEPARSVLWVPDRLEITDATAEVYGGTARFDYRMAPIGKRGVPTRAHVGRRLQDVDLARLTDFLETRGLRLAGRASGRTARMADRQVGAQAGRRRGRHRRRHRASRR